MRTTPKALFSLVGVLLLAACTDNNPVGVNGDASGTYTMNSVSGNSVPVTFPINVSGDTETIQGGLLTINTDGTFTQTVNFEDNISGQVTDSNIVCDGTFTQRGGTFSFAETATSDQNCGGNYSGTWNGSNAFSVAFNQSTIVQYTK
jgi:hypothetical protein